MLKRTIIFLLAALMLLSMGQTAGAVLNAVSPTTNPANHFPIWYQDTNGVAVEQCSFLLTPTSAQDPFCIAPGPAVAPIPNIGFDEAFWYAADSTIDATTAGAAAAGITSAILVQNLEAAFGTGDPVDGQQIVFARIRIRADVTTIGTYTVTYPYGVRTFNVDAVGAGNEINATVDIGLAPMVFTEALGGEIGPFLTCVAPAPPAGYIGNYGVPCTVSGSPTGNNFFSIAGPLGTVQTNLFNVSGKLFTTILPTPLVVDRVTYGRSTTSGQVDVFAVSTPTATVTVSGGANMPAGENPLTGDGTGSYFAHISLADASVIPAAVVVTATSATGSPTILAAALNDVVTITKADYSAVTKTLTVNAASSDKSAIQPTLTVTGFGAMTAGALTATAVVAPPPTVTVTSSEGGSAAALINVLTTFSISGTVTAGATPVPGVTVTLGGALSATTTTAADGTWSFKGLADGSYTVTASAAGASITPASIAVTVAGADVTGQNFPATYGISGTVTSGGLPQAGVTLSLSGAATQTATTGVDGTYSFTGLTNGSYSVVASRTGFTYLPLSLPAVINLASVSGVDFVGTAVAPPPGVTFSISGTVRIGGVPAAGVSVTLSGAAALTTTTAATGTYSFTGLSNGSYTITPAPTATDTFTPASITLTLAGTSVIGADFSGTAAPVQTGAFRIAGRVQDQQGNPLAGVTVNMVGPTSGSTVTDAQGNYSFTGLANGVYSVFAVPAISYQPVSRTITIKNGNRTGQNFKHL